MNHLANFFLPIAGIAGSGAPLDVQAMEDDALMTPPPPPPNTPTPPTEDEDLRRT